MSFHVRSGPWTPDQIERWLSDTVIPLRLATEGKRGPIVQSVWFSYAEGTLWCATQRDSVLAKRIRRDSKVGWEVARDEPPYRGARGTGVASVIADASVAERVLRGLVDRYDQSGTQLADWLLGRLETEVAVAITELRVTSWDFSPRMK